LLASSAGCHAAGDEKAAIGRQFGLLDAAQGKRNSPADYQAP
jgi:hypothetical protein